MSLHYGIVSGISTVGVAALAAGAWLVQAATGEMQLAQLLALGVVIGGVPTTVSLFVLRRLNDVSKSLGNLESLPGRIETLEQRVDDHIDRREDR